MVAYFNGVICLLTKVDTSGPDALYGAVWDIWFGKL